MKNWGKHTIFLALICIVLIIFSGSVSADSVNSTNATPLPDYNDIYVQTANKENISFNIYNNSTYYIQDLGSAGGLNAVHIAANSTSGANYGQYTTTSNQSGVFYVTDTGGRGYQDDVVLMLAVNGTIPDNFAVHIKASGYNWTPGDQNTAPGIGNITYQPVSLDETFYKSDFIYGSQNWKPAGGTTAYPIFYGENMSDPSNMIYIMFIDLHAGLLGSNYGYGNGNLIDYGNVKVEYTFENLYSFAAFNVYAWNANTSHGAGMGWTNSILPGQTGGPSGYTVIGSKKPSAAFTTSVTEGIVPLSVQFTDKSTGSPTSWAWDFDNDGTVDSTEQNPIYTYSTAGNYTVKLTVTNAYDSDQTTQYITIKIIDISADLPSGSYKTTQTVNVTASDNLYPNPKIYYTLDGSNPTTNGTLYNGSIILGNEGTTTLKFYAIDDNGNISDIVTRNYTIDKTSPEAIADPAGSTYNTRKSVTLNATDNIDANPIIYYTTDGSDPCISSTRVQYTSSLSINTTTTLRFASVDDAGNWSPVYNETYTMVDITAPIASADLLSGSYTTDQVVKLSAADEMDTNPKIYYALDGNDPTTNSTLYDWPISINIVGTTILKFIAVDAAGHISNIITRIYTLDKLGAGGTWNSTIIDNIGMYNSIAIDKSGNPHIAYYQTAQLNSYPKLNYAYKDSNGWHIETVDSAQAGAGFYVSMALDSLGNPHMVYGEVFGPNTTDKLKYAYKDSNGWHIIILDQNNYISYINLVLYNDQPRISFYNDTANNGAGELQYMYNNGTSWVIENVTPKSSGGRWNSLAIDSAGNPRISYYDTTSGPVQGSLRYAERTSDGVWKITIVDGNLVDPLNVGMWNSLALDSSGNPCISYNVNNGGGGILKYAYWNGTQWITETIDSLKSLCSKLVLTQSNSPIIVYQDVTTHYLKYAYKEGSKWIINNIDTVDGVGNWISLVLNSSGIPDVSYTTANSRLKYAYLVPFTINASTIGGNYNTTKMVSLISTAGTTIYYTKDGSDPRTSSTRVKYASSIMVNATMTLKFAAVDSANNWSSVHTETYTITDKTFPTASASLKSGLYNTNKSVSLTMSEIGTIYYTKNGTTPTTASIKYSGPISITSTITLKFIAIDGAGNKSPVYIMTYIIDKTAPKVISTYPKNYSRGISRTSTIAIKFSEKIKTSINWSKIYVKNLTTGRVISISKWISGNTLYIKTTYKRNAYNWYQVYIPSGAVKDYAGNYLATRYIFKFKTGKY